MSTSKPRMPTGDPKPGDKSANSAGPDGVERRRRRRAKISAPILVRTVNSLRAFEEVCKTLDASRDGLFFLSSHAGYSTGQTLEVTFPYSTGASALNKAQAAEVVRIVERNGGQFGVGVQFASAKPTVLEFRDNVYGAGTSSTGPAGQKTAALVLLVEADAQIADSMRPLLQQDGYTILVVPTAQAALEVLKTTVPTVFITETENADISGQDLCLIMRRNDRLQHVPAILLGESPQPADAACKELGTVVCLAKPFNPERLLHLIRLVAPPPSQRSVYGARLQPSVLERVL